MWRPITLLQQTRLDRKPFDLLLVDIRLPDRDGFELLAYAREKNPATPVILLTGYGTVETAIEAIRAGRVRFAHQAADRRRAGHGDRAGLNQREVIEENKNLKAQLDLRFGMENIVGHDHRMLRIFDMVESVADTKATVLVTGESGTGKSLIARAIHRRSSRRDKPFVEVACGALPETLLESELFGHVAGIVHRQRSATRWASSCRPTAARSFSTKSAPPARACK